MNVTAERENRLRLIGVRGIAVDKVIPPFLSIVLHGGGRRHADLVDEIAIRLLQIKT
jgi:hypothetical protein